MNLNVIDARVTKGKRKVAGYCLLKADENVFFGTMLSEGVLVHVIEFPRNIEFTTKCFRCSVQFRSKVAIESQVPHSTVPPYSCHTARYPCV